MTQHPMSQHPMSQHQWDPNAFAAPAGQWGARAMVLGAPEPPPPPTPWWSHAGAGLVALVTVLLLGAPVGLVWGNVAPEVPLVRLPDGGFTLDTRATEGSAFFNVDAAFLGVTAAVGLACGVLAWLGARRRGWPLAAGAIAGGLLASLVAAEVGSRVVVSQTLFDRCAGGGCAGGPYDGTPSLRARGLVLAWPLVVALVVAVLTLVRDDLSNGDLSGGDLSNGELGNGEPDGREPDGDGAAGDLVDPWGAPSPRTGQLNE